MVDGISGVVPHELSLCIFRADLERIDAVIAGDEVRGIVGEQWCEK